MPGNDPSFLVFAGSVASQLQDLSGKIFFLGGEVYRGAGTDPLGVVTLADPTVKKLGNATDTATKSCHCYSSFYGLDCTMLL